MAKAKRVTLKGSLIFIEPQQCKESLEPKRLRVLASLLDEYVCLHIL